MGKNEERIGVILDIDAVVSKAKAKTESLTKIFDNVGGNKGNQLRNVLVDISKEYEKLADESGKTMTKLGDFSKAEKSTLKLNQLFGKLEKEISNIGKMSTKDLANLFPEDIANKVTKASDAIKTFNTVLENSGKGKGAISQAAKEYEAQEKAVRKAIQAVEDLEKVKNGTSKKSVVSSEDKNDMVVKVEEAKAKATELKKVYKNLREEMEKFEQTERENAAKQGKESMFDKGTQNYSKPYRELRDRVEEAKDKMNEAADAAKDLNNQLDNMVVVGDLEKDLQSARDALVDAQNKAALLKKNLDSVSASEFNRALDEAKKKLQGLSGIDLSKITNLDDLNKLFDDFTKEGVEGLKRGLQQAGIEIKELDNVNDQLVTSVDNATIALKKQNQALDDINGIKNRILQFFSLTEGVQLARRVISQATEAIRELDKAMTETATVTDFSVGDMWDALPRYTQAANELGATTLGAYETMTLFYQQGLDTNAVFEIGTETMKMARIAGLDYAEATDLMTAALRGFNMELNETSAQRVNDVYSELAAITAADTEEIANAMTKTASIANSANMEFETTAALLSQIVETTREPAETAGTAMKTIIARFTEMKKATSDIIDVDGEEVDVNKVEAALKSAGVALRDVNGEFRDLDDVFLELASRWDSLDMMTQRYVATMAAGSRQQSRFIAMMSDYDRTMELVDAAYDSAGASAKQFAKTQDSFEAKTNNLKNAWNEYLLSLANSDVVKGVIDLLTKLINVINDLTEGGGSFQSSMLKVFTAVAGFKAIGSMFGQAFSQLPTLFTQEGQSLGGALRQGIQTGINNVKFNFPFIGTLSKEIKALSKEMEQIGGRKTNFGDLRGISGNITNITKKSADKLGQQMNTYLSGQLKKVQLTNEGKEWANGLITGFVENLKKDGRVDRALDELQTEVNDGLKDPVKNTGKAPKIKVNKAGFEFNKKDFEDITQKADQAAIALTSVGMVFSALGSKLSEQSGALGIVGDGLEVIGNSASATGMALSTLNAITKTFNITLSTGTLGAIIGVVAAASILINIISKYNQLKKEAQQSVIDTAKEQREEAEANRELAKSLEDTIEAYKDGAATREQVAEASSELIEKYGLENESVQLLTGSYEALTKAINDKILAQEKENYASQQGAANTYRDQLYDAGLYHHSYSGVSGADVNDEIKMTEEFKTSFNELLSEYNLEDVILTQGHYYGEFLAMFSSMSDQQLADFGKFQERYSQLLANTLTEQGLDPEESEVYKNLTQMINKTESHFEGLNGAVKSARESLLEIADVEFKEKYQGQNITNRSEYDIAKGELKTILKKQDNDLTDDELEAIIAEYFGQDSSTKGFSEADAIISKLSHFSDKEKGQIGAYKDYDSGKITAEEFVRQLGLIDFEGLKIDDINNLVTTNQFKSAVSAPQDFLNASSGISGYINENYTMEGISQTELDGFRAYLSSISSLLPSNINAIEMWDQALQQGTIGVSNFLIQIQHLLSTQSLMASETVLNNKAYGIAGTDADIKKDSATWNSEGVTEAQKKEILVRYQFTFEGDNSAYASFEEAAKAFEEKLKFYNKDYEKQIEEITEKINTAETNYDNKVKEKTNNIDSKISGKKTRINELEQEKEEIKNSKKSDFVKEMEIRLKESSIRRLHNDISELESEKITLDVDDADVKAAKESLEAAKAEMDALEEKKAVKFQIEVENAMADAEQITTLRTQLAQLKELCDNGFKVDLSTFEQMREICPAIADDVKVLSDGTIDVSAGMEALNAQLAEQVGIKGDSAKATLDLAVAEENALQAKLQAAIDAIDAELAAMEAGNAEKTEASATTNAALSALTEDGCLDRAKLFEQEANDQGDAAIMGAQTVINTVDAMDDAYQRFGGTLDEIHLKMKNLGTDVYTDGMSAADVQAAQSKLVKDTSFTADAGNYDGKDIEEYLEGVSKITDGAERKKKLEETKALLQALKDKSIIREGDYNAMISALNGGGNNYGVKDDDKGGKSSGDKNKNTTNSKLKNVDQQLEDLDRKREKGEINALEYQTQRNQLLTTKHGLLETDLNSTLSQAKGAVYYDKKSDSIKYNNAAYNKLSDEDKTKVDKIYEEAKKICTDMNKIEDEVGSIEKNQTNDTTNEDEKLKALERDRKNGKVSAEEYSQQKKDLLTSKYGKLTSEFNYQLANNPENEFFKYDAKTDTLQLNEKKYSQLSDERKKEVKSEFDDVNKILEEMNTIEDQVDELNNLIVNDTTNNKSTQEALDRQLERGKIGVGDYSSKMLESLENEQAKLQNQFNDKFSKSADKVFFKYDKALDTILIDEDKLALLNEEQREAVLKEYETLKDINDQLNDVEDSIKAAKKYLKYDTTNTDVRSQALDEDYQNGNMDPLAYQKAKVETNKSENRSLRGENNSIMNAIMKDVGPIYYNKEEKQFKWNPLFDKSTLTPEEIEAIETWMNGEKDAQGNRTGGKNAELKEAYKNNDSKAKNAIKDAYHSSGYQSVYYGDEVTGLPQYDEFEFDYQTQTAKDLIVDNVTTYAANVSQIKQNNEENEKLLPQSNSKYDTTDIDQKLKNLERDYENGNKTYSEYLEERNGYYNQLIGLQEGYATDLYQNSQYKDYVTPIMEERVDENGKIYEVVVGIAGVTDDYYKLGEEQRDEIDTFIDTIDGIAQTTDEMKDIMRDPDFKDDPEGTKDRKTAAEKRAEYQQNEAELWNNKNDQAELEEDRYDLSRLEGVVGQLSLPQEIQTALGMGFTAAEMGYEAREITNLNAEYASLDDNRKLTEQTKEYVGSKEEVMEGDDKYKVYYFDPTTGQYEINAEKAAKLTPEEWAKVQEEMADLNSRYADRMKAILRELSGGIIQEGTRKLGLSLKGLSKAFEQEEYGTYKVSDALDDMEAALGLASGSLDGFEGALTKIAEGAGKISFKSLGKDVSPLTSLLESKNLGGVANLFEMVLGSGVGDSGGFTGADLLGSASGAMGQMLEMGSGFLNWDMISGGVEMFTQGIALGQQIYDRIKQGIEKIKQVIEQVIQYISQATQVLVDAWTNREDYLYNYLKLIEKHLQEYENLQRYSTQIQKGRIATADDIAKNWEDQWASLQKQLEEQTERLETRQEELDRSRWNPFSLISGWDPLSDTLYENREVKMLWDIIIGLGEAFAPLGTGTFFSQLNQLYEDYDQRVQQSYEDRLAAEQALLDIEDERLELVKVGADEATQFEDKVLEALLQKEQAAIDELSRLNEAVTTANQKLMSTLQDNLSKIRQDRENEKKEEELGEKERRLAYLRQDTSGANTMEIKRLEKELDEQHEDYTDTLIDQKISELEKQNELAAEQRQQQIDLLQGQLDYAEKYGLYWETIYDMLYSIDENGKVVINADNFDVDGNIRENSQLAQLLGTYSDRMGMSTWQSVLDNEETKLLGLYYKAFMTRNGADGNWADYWALLDPGANDPDYTRQMAEIPDGLRGVLSRLEISIREYFGTSNPGIVNGVRGAEQSLKNFFGKMFNYEPWKTYQAEPFNKAYVEADTMNAIHRTEVAIVDSIKDGFNNFFGLNQKAAQTGKQTTEKAKSNNNNYGTQNYGAVTENYNFNIGTVGENISLDDMVDKVTSAIKGLFTGNINSYKKSQ